MTTAPRSPRLLVLSTVMLTVAGIALLGMPYGPKSPAAATATASPPRPRIWHPRPL
jgi:hypothetical protein